MKRAHAVIRSLILWSISWLHFVIGVPLILFLGAVFGQRRTDRLLCVLSRNVHWLAGVRVEVNKAPGFDPTRTSLLVSNHVNVFDPFVLYSSVPVFFRGLELESHFRVPFYGWLMRRFGNVPVSENRTASAVKRTFRLTKKALDDGISLLVFPEGSRTLDGRVGPFSDGAFVMARQFGYPIVPISITGSFEFKHKGDWMLRPSRVVVYIHDTIETAGLTKRDVPALRDRVRAIVARPVDAYYDRRAARSVAQPV